MAGLGDALSSGHWTVFAPTNQAFEKLGDLLSDVLADKALLTDILLFHAVPEVVGSEDLHCTETVEMANAYFAPTQNHRSPIHSFVDSKTVLEMAGQEMDNNNPWLRYKLAGPDIEPCTSCHTLSGNDLGIGLIQRQNGYFPNGHTAQSIEG